MPQPADQYEPASEDGPMTPLGWTTTPVMSTALAAECACPVDCPRDHENE